MSTTLFRTLVTRRHWGRMVALAIQLSIVFLVSTIAIHLHLRTLPLTQLRTAYTWLSEVSMITVSPDDGTLPDLGRLYLAKGPWRRLTAEEVSQASTAPDEAAPPWTSNFLFLDTDATHTLSLPVAKGRWFAASDFDSPSGIPVVLNRAAAERIVPVGQASGFRFGVDQQFVVVGLLQESVIIPISIGPGLPLQVIYQEPLILVAGAPSDPAVDGGRGSFARTTALGLFSPTSPMAGPSLAHLVDTNQEQMQAPLRLLILVCIGLWIMAGVGVVGSFLTLLEHRYKELAIQLALGASPRRLAELVAVDITSLTILCSLIGGTAAIFLLKLGGQSPDWARLLLSILVFALIMGLLVGTAPFLAVYRLDPAEALSER